MTQVNTYQDMKVSMRDATITTPAYKVALARQITMSKDLDNIKPLTERDCAFLLDAEHTSLFEHVFYTFLIKGVSRSFLGQITRQREASPTSGSQHYQNYSDYPCVVSEKLFSCETMPPPEEVFKYPFEDYTAYMNAGVPREEARQVLPMAATVNYLWTINARSLILFLRHRLCYRNCEEMLIFAQRVLLLCRGHFPELFNRVHRMCWMDGRCKQGHLRPKNCEGFAKLQTGEADYWSLQKFLA